MATTATTDWTAMGREAFAMGLPAAPLADPAVAVTVAEMSVGSGAAAIMRAWTQGWHSANLAAPVPEGS